MYFLYLLKCGKKLISIIEFQLCILIQYLTEMNVCDYNAQSIFFERYLDGKISVLYNGQI